MEGNGLKSHRVNVNGIARIQSGRRREGWRPLTLPVILSPSIWALVNNHQWAGPGDRSLALRKINTRSLLKAASHLAQTRKFHPRLSMMSQYQSGRRRGRAGLGGGGGGVGEEPAVLKARKERRERLEPERLVKPSGASRRPPDSQQRSQIQVLSDRIWFCSTVVGVL